MEGALVVFVSDYRDDPPAHGVTDADGRYHVNTFFAGHDIPRGAVPGRHYSIYIEKFEGCDGTIVCQKMAEIAAAGGDVPAYVRERAIYDLWPKGVPEDWPLDYIPSMGIPRRLLDNPRALEKITRLQKGIPLLPAQYGDTATSGFEATVERSNKPQEFNFELFGPVEDIKIRRWDSASPPSEAAPPLKEAHRFDGRREPSLSDEAFSRGTPSRGTPSHAARLLTQHAFSRSTPSRAAQCLVLLFFFRIGCPGRPSRG